MPLGRVQGRAPLAPSPQQPLEEEVDAEEPDQAAHAAATAGGSAKFAVSSSNVEKQGIRSASAVLVLMVGLGGDARQVARKKHRPQTTA